jgi:hypothetical protein
VAVPDLAPPPPHDVVIRSPRSHRIALACFKVAALSVVLVVVFQVTAFGVAELSWEAAIPPSCQEPSTIDYSNVGRPDYGPYVVKVVSWNLLPSGATSRAVVGHGLTVDSQVSYGVWVELDSTDIHAFACRWNNEGVTIVEPGHAGQAPGFEHFIPARQFLGGR